MRCLLCERWSAAHICRRCIGERLRPSLHTRKIAGTIPVHSFYAYDDIEPLLLSKHTDLGFHIYTILAETAFASFAATFSFDKPVAAVGVDDHVRHGYSHTALLVRQMKSSVLNPYFGHLRDDSGYRYSGRDFQYRLTHPRRFVLKPFAEEYVILVDDILTTGLTLTQAAETLGMNGKHLLFALTLADAQR